MKHSSTVIIIIKIYHTCYTECVIAQKNVKRHLHVQLTLFGFALSIVHGSEQEQSDAASDQPNTEPDTQQHPHIWAEVGGEQVEQQRSVAEREQQAEEEGQQRLVQVCSAPQPQQSHRGSQVDLATGVERITHTHSLPYIVTLLHACKM